MTSVNNTLVQFDSPAGPGLPYPFVALTPMAAPNDDGTRVSIGGARGVQNNLPIDGASYQSNFFGEQRGSTRIPFTFGADTIRELQIITNAYDAQYGNAAGAIINAVSKSGSNEFAGFRPWPSSGPSAGGQDPAGALRPARHHQYRSGPHPRISPRTSATSPSAARSSRTSSTSSSGVETSTTPRT